MTKTLLSAVIVGVLVAAGSVIAAGNASATYMCSKIDSNIVECTWAAPGSSKFTVPKGVTALEVDVYGGGGGAGYYRMQKKIYAPGGFGAQLHATLEVQSGQALQFTVGGRGMDGWEGLRENFGGFGGGGMGLNDGGGGGGASDIRNAAADGTYPLGNRLIVAGGGGGGVGDSAYNRGGNGGYPVGSDGYGNSFAGKGGTQTSGGKAGGQRSSDPRHQDGRLGFGGNGGYRELVSINGGGAGGGGYYGGGGGEAPRRGRPGTPAEPGGGGGGGSSYASAQYTSNVSVKVNDRSSGPGQIVIRYVGDLP